jgi:hypothetical protein
MTRALPCGGSRIFISDLPPTSAANFAAALAYRASGQSYLRLTGPEFADENSSPLTIVGQTRNRSAGRTEFTGSR